MTAEIPLEDPAEPGLDARPGAVILDQDFSADTLHLLREAVLAHATEAGLSGGRAIDIMLTVHELAANVVRHGGGAGQLRIHMEAGVLHCQIDCQIAGPGCSSVAPGPDPWPRLPGHGLWLVQQAADRFTARSSPYGSQATASFILPS